MASLVILNTISPPKLADDLILYGHHVWEALDVSEALFLCEQEEHARRRASMNPNAV